MAREFRGNDRGCPETFAPTLGIGSKLVLLLHICLRWFLSFMDIKDAFLLVLQQERVLVLVEQPRWYAGEGETKYWTLAKCLPGQRNAASRFFNSLCDHLNSLEFSSTPLLPSLFRHQERDLVLCSHVDDLIVCGSQGDVAVGKEIDFVWWRTIGTCSRPRSKRSKRSKRSSAFLVERHFFTNGGMVSSRHEK